MCCLLCCKDVVKIAGRGLCPSCYALQSRAGTLIDWPTTYRKISDTLEEYEFLRWGGASKETIAKQLGLKVTTLNEYLQRVERRR